jgi:aminoglycoside phosphotransferase (APT) family kinase protein
MAVPSSRDIAATERQLARFLEATHPDLGHVEVTVLPSSAGTGFSGESLMFDARCLDSTTGAQQVVECVARIRPDAYTLYQDHDLELQWRVIDALSRGTDVPVPRIIAHDAIEGTWLGQQCFVMERIAGSVPADLPPYTVKGWMKDASADDQRRAYVGGLEVLAKIHAADWSALGLGFLRDSSNPAGLQVQLAHDEQFLAWIGSGRTFSELTSASQWLREHVPDDGVLALSWGDARLGNMLFRDFRPVAVLDWEMATLAAPGADLGWWLVFNLIHSVGIDRPSLPGIPSDAEAIEIYQRSAGVEVTDLLFYEVRAALRAAMLLVRFSDAMVANGTLAPAAADRPYTPAVNVLRYLLQH